MPGSKRPSEPDGDEDVDAVSRFPIPPAATIIGDVALMPATEAPVPALPLPIVGVTIPIAAVRAPAVMATIAIMVGERGNCASKDRQSQRGCKQTVHNARVR